MNKLVRGALAAALAMLVMLGAAVPALAAPTPLEKIDVTMHDDNGSAVVLVTGYLPEKTPLPATMELAVPKGGTFQWAGEILGGDPSADPSVKYEVKQVDGLDVYTFTLTKARVGQIEVTNPSVLSANGAERRVTLPYAPSADVPLVSIFARVPSGAQVTEPSQEAGMTEGPPGYSYYTRVAKDVKAGTALDLTFAYTAPAGAPTGGTSPAPTPATNNTLPTVLIAALALGALALVGIGLRAKMNPVAEEEAEADGSPRKVAAKASEPATKPQSGKKAAKATPARTVAAENPGDEEEFVIDADDIDDETEAAPRPRRASKAPIIIAVVVIGIIIGGFIAADSGTSTQQFEGKFTRDFGNQSACGTKQLPLAVEGSNAEAYAEKVFASLKGLQGLGKVTVDVSAKRVDVGFCESQVSEDQIQGAVTAAGLLGEGEITPAVPNPPAQ